MPLFPLGTVLLPGAPLPLRIFEPRYQQLIADLQDLPASERRFGVVAIREGHEVGEGGVTALHDVGCVALVTDITPCADGTFEVSTVGTSRFKVQALNTDRAYFQAEVELLPEPTGDVAAIAELVRNRYADYRRALGDIQRATFAEPELPADPRLLSYLVAATIVADLADRQEFLGQLEASDRLAAEARWLVRETSLLRELAAVPAAALLRVPQSVN